jgi:large subunit ribosomal protein L9
MYSIRNNLIRLNRNIFEGFNRSYTVRLERHEHIPPIKKELDPRKFILKSRHFQYKFVDCSHTQKWGNIDLILTDYIEGIGHKGEIVSVPRHTAYYDLLPTGRAVYITNEYLDIYKKDRDLAAKKAKVSPYALKTQEVLENLLLEIPMNTSVEWTLTKDNVRLALRYKVNI